MSKTNCPEDGTCTFEVLKQSSLSIEKDGIGATYPKIEKGNKVILKFEYKRNEIKDIQDGSYRELIYVEIDSDINTLTLTNKELHKAKVLFARLCFCRGQTGYYPVKEGELKVSKNTDSTYTLSLDFKINEVPQVIHTIHETFVL